MRPAAAALLALLLLGRLGAASAPRAWNADKDGLLLGGWDPVAYVMDGRAERGRPDLEAPVAAGVRARFASEAHRREFLKDPARWLPAYGGWCAYAMADGDFVEVDPGTFKVLNGTVHLFYNGWLGNTLPKWNRDEAALKARADAAWARLFPAPSPVPTPPRKATRRK